MLKLVGSDVPGCYETILCLAIQRVVALGPTRRETKHCLAVVEARYGVRAFSGGRIVATPFAVGDHIALGIGYKNRVGVVGPEELQAFRLERF